MADAQPPPPRSEEAFVNRPRRSRGDFDLEPVPRKVKRCLFEDVKVHEMVLLHGQEVNSAVETTNKATSVASTSGPLELTNAETHINLAEFPGKRYVARFSLQLLSTCNMSPDDRDALHKAGLARIVFTAHQREFGISRKMLKSLSAAFDLRLIDQPHCTFHWHHGVLRFQSLTRGYLEVNRERFKRPKSRHLKHGDIISIYKTSTASLEYKVSMHFHRSKHTDKVFRIDLTAAAPLIGLDRQGKLHPIPDIRVEQQYDCIQQSVGRHGIQVRPVVATWPQFRTVLTHGSRVVHFIGQGNDEHVYFEDNLGMVHPVAYSELLPGLNTDVKLVVLSYAPAQPLVNAFVAHGVPHVVVVHDPRRISAFYAALLSGQTVQASVDAVVSSYPAALSLFPFGRHDAVIYPHKHTKRPITAQPYSSHELPLPPTYLCTARHVDIFRICEVLALKLRLVTIAGRAGSGKTATAIAVAHRVGHRHKILKVGSKISFIDVPSLMANMSPTSEEGIWDVVRVHTQTHRANISKWPTLIFLDGCDVWMDDEEQHRGLRELLETWFVASSTLQVVLTARQPLTTKHRILNLVEELYYLDELAFDPSGDSQQSEKGELQEEESNAAVMMALQEKEALNSKFQRLSLETVCC
ncbi:unnamed protein product [Aphanomyces euteiches]